MTLRQWPWPEDNRIDKLKRIVDSYRTRLQEVDPTGCQIIDGRMAEYGETWLADNEIVNVNEEKTVEEIYAQFGPGFEPHNIHKWAQREPRILPRRGTRNGKTLYRLGDVLAYQVSLR